MTEINNNFYEKSKNSLMNRLLSAHKRLDLNPDLLIV